MIFISQDGEEVSIDYLKQAYLDQSSDEYAFTFALHCNLDESERLLLGYTCWDKCDKATALVAYWRHSPEYWNDFRHLNEVHGFQREDYERFMSLQERYLSSYYHVSQIALDPVALFSPAYGPLDVLATIPAMMKQSLTGKTVDHEDLSKFWDNGNPEEVWRSSYTLGLLNDAFPGDDECEIHSPAFERLIVETYATGTLEEVSDLLNWDRWIGYPLQSSVPAWRSLPDSMWRSLEVLRLLTRKSSDL